MTDTLSVPEVADQAPDGFHQILRRLHARYRTGDFATALALVDRVAAVAEEMNHHPDLDLRWGRVDVRLSSHDAGGITDRDLTLARRIGEIAAEVGATPDPAGIVEVEIGLDTWDSAEIVGFWRAVLGYGDPDDEEVVDPGGDQPTLWFQDTDRHDPPRQRHHLDVWVPAHLAEDRVRAAVDAGGTLVDDAAAPSFWVLADQQGNRVCICTVRDRAG